ncbi:MAG: DNA topoisomerase I, partial [Bacteroidales bacterium]|nr:DNA topoisomerase I [Bacteroidales bacterium]
IGEYKGLEVIATKGRFGPYLKWGEQNISLPRGKDPLNVSLEECISIIESDAAKKQASAAPLHEWTESGISVLNGRYGPYIKFGGNNYRIPRGVDAEKLTEEACKQIISNGTPTAARRYTKKK